MTILKLVWSSILQFQQSKIYYIDNYEYKNGLSQVLKIIDAYLKLKEYKYR